MLVLLCRGSKARGSLKQPQGEPGPPFCRAYLAYPRTSEMGLGSFQVVLEQKNDIMVGS